MAKAYGSLTVVDLLDTATYIYYATDGNGSGAAISPVNKNYIGIYSGPPLGKGQPAPGSSEYNKIKAQIAWSKYHGEKGDKGDKGEAGNGIKETIIKYSVSASGSNPPSVGDSHWQSTIPRTSPSYPYLWTRTQQVFTNGSVSYSYSVSSNLEGVEIGGRNLILNSHFCLQENGTWMLDLSISKQQLRGKRIVMSVDLMTKAAYGELEKYSRVGMEIHFRYKDDPNHHYVGIWENFYKKESNFSGRKFYTYQFLDKEIVELNFGCYIQGISKGQARICNPKLEFGNRPTDWTPAPEDSETQIEDSSFFIEAVPNEMTKFYNEKGDKKQVPVYSSDRLTFYIKSKIGGITKSPQQTIEIEYLPKQNCVVLPSKDQIKLPNKTNSDGTYVISGFQTSSAAGKEMFPGEGYFICRLKEGDKILAIKIVQNRFGTSDDMAKFAVNANSINAAIQDSKMEFTADGLALYGGGFKMAPAKGKNSVLTFDSHSQRFKFDGDIYAKNGSFSGTVDGGLIKGSTIQSLKGVIGGFQITEEELYATKNKNIVLNGSKGLAYAKNLTLGQGAFVEKEMHFGGGISLYGESNYLLDPFFFRLNEGGWAINGRSDGSNGPESKVVIDNDKFFTRVLKTSYFYNMAIVKSDVQINKGDEVVISFWAKAAKEGNFSGPFFTDGAINKPITDNNKYHANQDWQYYQFEQLAKNAFDGSQRIYFYCEKNTLYLADVSITKKDSSNGSKNFLVIRHKGKQTFLIEKEGNIQLGPSNNYLSLNGPEGSIASMAGGKTNWKLSNDRAYFKNVSISGELETCILKKGEVQAVGGILIVRPSSILERVEGGWGYLKDATGFEAGGCCRIKQGNTDFQFTLSSDFSVSNKKFRIPSGKEVTEGAVIIYLGKTGDIGIGINSSEEGTFMTPEAISVNTLEANGNYNPRIILGQLPDNKEEYGAFANSYGLYAENVLLKGSLVTKRVTTENNKSVNYYSGVSTLYEAGSAPTSANTFRNNWGEIVFWAGALGDDKKQIENSPFFIDTKGNMYCNSGRFKGSVITDATIEASSLKTTTIIGTGDKPALVIRAAETGKAISFYDNDTGDEYISFSKRKIAMNGIGSIVLNENAIIDDKGVISAPELIAGTSLKLASNKIINEKQTINFGSNSEKITFEKNGIETFGINEIGVKSQVPFSVESSIFYKGEKGEYRPIINAAGQVVGYDLYIKE